MKECQSAGKWISMLYRYGHKFIDKELEKYGIGYGQFSILMQLYRKDRVLQETIAEKLSIDKTTTARTIKKLETLQFINRLPNPEDQRAYLVCLTEKAQALKEEIIPITQKWTDFLLNGMNEQEMQLFFQLLEKAAHNAKHTLEQEM